MKSPIDTLLLLALPASGKSELRRYFATLDPEVGATDFRLGPTVQLDDYPYVHLMRRIDEELRNLDAGPVFFAANEQPMLKARDWATLIELVNEDYASLGSTPAVPAAPTAWLFERFDRARNAAGVPPPFDELPEELVEAVAASLDDEIADYARKRSAVLASYELGVSTVLIEFARGGPVGTKPPLPEPHGYTFSLSFLSPDILRRARRVVRVGDSRGEPPPQPRAGTTRARRRRIDAPPWRARSGHARGLRDRRLPLAARTRRWRHHRGRARRRHVPAPGRRLRQSQVDHTSFLRGDPASWDAADVEALHADLVEVFAELE